MRLMEVFWCLGATIFAFQVVCCVVPERSCTPGFDSEIYTFNVDRVTLHVDERLGNVVFDDCTSHTQSLLETTDEHFGVETDGTVQLKKRLTLHDGHKRFSVHGWDAQGRKHMVAVHVELGEPYHHPQDHREDLQQLDVTEAVPILKRRKRDWIIPPISISEGYRGPFPQKIAQIRTSHDKEVNIVYSIKGQGADEAPSGLFTINKLTGHLYVTQQLDREKQSNYSLFAHAVSEGGYVVEQPMEIMVIVIDQNDNKPVFERDPFLGSVAESSLIGTEFMDVVATDADEPGNANSDIRYKILSQEPALPQGDMFDINPLTGKIRVKTAGLDKEKISNYALKIQVADLEGEGLTADCKAIITITDSNDNAPKFDNTQYTVMVPENKVGEVVVRMPVTDEDDPNTEAWAAKFKIISGDSGGMFSIETGPNKQEGIIKTAKALDFEKVSKYTLVVAVENEVPFAVSLPTSTAQVVVSVGDVNEAPVFNPVEKTISKPENDPPGTALVQYSAMDPDTAMKQKVTYKVGSDPAGWLNVDKDTGLMKLNTKMDRESIFVKDNLYKALILAIDDDVVPATGTGTLIIQLQDVNDNPPALVEKLVQVCNEEPAPVLLTVLDRDSEENGPPYYTQLIGDSTKNWTVRMNDTKTGIILNMKNNLPAANYNISLTLSDRHGLSQVAIVEALVCDCKGANFTCSPGGGALYVTAGFGIVGGILALLSLMVFVAIFVRSKRKVKEEMLLADDDIRDTIYYYDEEGGGEDDQDYDLGVLHRGLDDRPGVFRNDVIPTYATIPKYRPRPANPEDVGNFIDDNLKAADNDPSAPPFDTLLIFDEEGGGSEAGSLSSIGSSDSGGDQDYDCFKEWGPRFKKLADMYGGGEEE